MKTDKRIMKAAKLQESGKTVEAEAIFRIILKNNPADFVSSYSLGVIEFNRNDYVTALDYFDKAKKINSAFAPLWYNVGLILSRLEKYQEAVINLDQAIKLDPAYEAARKQRDSIVNLLKHHVDQPAADTVNNYTEKISRAVELQNEGRLDASEALFLEILADKPSDIPCLYSLGVLELIRKNPEKALSYFEQGLAAKPDYAPLWYNRGVVLHSLKQHDKAVESYDKALAFNPAYTEAMINRGAVLVEMKRHKDALVNYEELLKISPNNDKALCNRGIILTDFKLNDLAIQTFERLLLVSPDYDYALGLLSFAKLHACSWDNLDKYNSMIIEGIHSSKRVCKSQALLAISNEPHDHLLCAQIFARHFYPAQKPIWQGEIYDHKKIRIAYISPDFREHPVGHLTAGIFENHDKDKFEIIAISLGVDDNSRLRERMLSSFDKFIDVRLMSSRDVAAMMRSMEIDIAVDLGGYTADTRTDILAWRPAPIQVNYLGYSSTMGAEYIDYIIADRCVIPEEYQDCYSEKVVYLPDVYLPTDSSVKIADHTPPREEYGLPANGFVFCSFNHDYKINPQIFNVWMRLLKQVPGSILWLMKLNESAEQNLRKEAEARGVDALRIVFATRVPRIEDHLARYRLADLFLDTTPYNAHTTTSDVLRAGLPVLTCMGKAFAGRVAGSLLNAVGLPELITHSLEEYENLALKLAQNQYMLAGIKKKLQENLLTSPLYDTGRYCLNLEAAYTDMCVSYQSGKKPKSLSVTDNTIYSKNTINQNSKCSVCGGSCSLLDVVDFNKSCEEVRGKFISLAGIPVYYTLCTECGFCFCPEIGNWSFEEFRERIYNDRYVTVDPDYIEIRPRANAENLISMFGDRASSLKHLDYGGGDGLLVEILRASSWNSTSYDPFVKKDSQIGQYEKYDLITAFEVFEHASNVSELMQNICSLLSPEGVVFFSTLLSDGNINPNQRLNWWYASPRNGHISLFSKKSLTILAHKHGFSFGTFGVGHHVFFAKVPPWADHIICKSQY